MIAIDDLKQQITAARSRSDSRELNRLQAIFRTHPGVVTTAASRGHQLPQARMTGSPLARPAARDVLTRAPAAQTVAITSSVRDSLDDSFDGREAGGFLIGPITSDGEIFATGMIAPAYDEDRTGTSVVLDLLGAVAILETLPADQTIVGDWHVHPGWADTQPSSADQRSWERLSEFFARPWLAIIARNAPTKVVGLNGRLHDTSPLELVATLVRRDSYGKFEHRSINITERSF
jgi:proteasome lid subunit RPN8/RPN11